MIGLYDKWIFIAKSQKMGRRSSIDFVDVWNGTQDDFIAKYHKLYPNDEIHIFRHPKKSMSILFRQSIEEWMETSPVYKQYLRDFNIDELLS
jgi:hypothetical protein